MIPKVIHYCWFGRGKMPELANKCIASWKKYLPDHEIKEWNEDNFDVNMIPYTAEAYKAKKYAFVSDYARFWILYNFGGIYFDTDVEVIKSMSDIIKEGPFMGFENNGMTAECLNGPSLGVNPGLGLGAMPGLGLYKELLDYYACEHFLNKDGSQNLKTIVLRTTSILKNHGLVEENKIQTIAGITIYPYEYFCPIRITDGRMFLTAKTFSIHHYAASWTTPLHRLLRKIILAIGGYKLKDFLTKLR